MKRGSAHIIDFFRGNSLYYAIFLDKSARVWYLIIIDIH